MSDPRPPTAGSSNYIQNGTSPQSSSNFNVSGTGTANIFNATTQYNIGGSRILSNPGTNNLFAGAGAGSAITTGAQNHFFGSNAGAATSTGAFNSFFGNSAGTNNTLGNSNSFFGGGAGAGNLTGGGNSFFGLNAGSSNVFGALNTIIGTGANVGADNLTNATAIGARAFVTQSNSLILGAISGVNNCVPTSCDSVNVGIGTTTPAYPLTAIGTAGSGASQGVVEFSNSANDTGVRIRNSASNGRTYTLFSSGGGSGIGAGNLNIYDATASQSRLTITPNGSVGIGTTSPTFPLSFANIVGDKISLAPNGAASYGFGVQSLLLQVHTDISASDIGFGYGSSSAFTENMRIKGNGNVGIGTASPASVLHLGGNSGSFAMTFTNVANTAGRRGYRLAFDNDRFSFQRADDAGNFAANQVAIDQATGNVGIGTTNPAATLEVNGYTKLGSDAPAIKVMKLTGTTPATEGGFVQVIHGLDPAKILSVSILVNSTFWWIPPHDTGGGSRYSWLLNGNRIEIFNALGDSAQILSKPMRITIMYEQ